MIWSTDQLLARAAFIDRQIETWKGNPGYADTLRMEAWALRAAAAYRLCVLTEKYPAKKARKIPRKDDPR